MSPPDHVLWLGSAGTATAFGVARSVRAVWGQRVGIVAADVNPPHLVAAAALADSAEQVPYLADADGFADTLAAGLQRHGADTYMPLLVEEILLAARLRAAGSLPPGITVLAPGVETAEACTDKLELANLLAAHGVPVPPTSTAGQAQWWPEGVVVKSRRGEGSRDVQVCTSESELEAARSRGTEAVAQRMCQPPEVTVDAFRSGDGSIFRALCRERIEVKAGVSTKARAFTDPALEDICRRLADALELPGALTIQAMRGPDGWEITDVNPRCGGGTRLAAAVGVDTTAAALADVWGEDPGRHLEPFEGEAWIVRHYEELVSRRA